MRLVFIMVSFVVLGCKNDFTTSSTNKTLNADEIDSLLLKRSFIATNGEQMPYRLFSPYNGEGKKNALIVFLHGRGDRGNDNSSKIYREAGIITNPNSLLSSHMQEQYPCYVLVPQCSAITENEEWAKWIGNTPKTPFKGLGKDGSYKIHPRPSNSGEAAIELVEKIISENPIDPNRVYIVGVSMGGFGTWEFVYRRPNLFAAAVPMAGYSDPSQIENIKHIPFWIFHGSEDQWNPVEGSRKMYNLLTAKKADVKYTEYKNTGHGETFQKAFKEKELLPWLFSKSK